VISRINSTSSPVGAEYSFGSSITKTLSARLLSKTNVLKFMPRYPSSVRSQGSVWAMRRRRLEFSDAFAQVLQRQRSAKKLSKQALAEKAELHQTYVGMIERGLSNPSLDAACAIAEALEVPFSKLIAEAESLRERAESTGCGVSVEKPKNQKRNKP
jgi:DNA-binding XRE family transcriptional regulator